MSLIGASEIWIGLIIMALSNTGDEEINDDSQASMAVAASVNQQIVGNDAGNGNINHFPVMSKIELENEYVNDIPDISNIELVKRIPTNNQLLVFE